MTNIMMAITEASDNHYTCFGVRKGYKANIGDYLENSHDYDIENDCSSDEYLDGTCATNIGMLWFDGEEDDEEAVRKAIEYNAKHYAGEMQYIIAGKCASNGYDDHEIIIENAVVIAIVE